MKALALLSEYANIDFGCDMNMHIEECKEAIAELKALQQRSCDGCKFHDDVGWDDWCCDCIRKWTIDRYEPKDIQ